jgi:hypothetical protein
LTSACLKDVGKLPSDRERLIRVVIGTISASRQDLRSLVGRRSESQVESEDAAIAFLTSSMVVGIRTSRGGG